MNNFNLFGIGPMELIFVLIIALVVMGPERLPQVAREMAKMMAQVREIYTEIMGTLTKEFGDMEELKEIQRDLNSLRDPLNLNKLVNPPSKSPANKSSSTPKRSTAEQLAQSTAAPQRHPPPFQQESANPWPRQAPLSPLYPTRMLGTRTALPHPQTKSQPLKHPPTARPSWRRSPLGISHERRCAGL